MARTRLTARKGTVPCPKRLQMATAVQKYTFFKVKTERFKESETKYVVRCGIKDCDMPLTKDNLIFTTFNQKGDHKHYHIECYEHTNNFRKNHFPSSTKQITDYDKLNLGDQYKINEVLFPQIQPYKYQLFALFDERTPDAYTLNRYGLQDVLRERDIEVYKQKDEWKAGEFTRNSAYRRLQEHYNHPECKIKFECLVEGYIKFYIRMSGPAVVHYLILQFSKIYFRKNLYNVK